MIPRPENHRSSAGDREIATAAAEWFVRAEENNSPEFRAALEQWRAADPRHAAAYARIAATRSALRQLSATPRGQTLADAAQRSLAARSRQRRVTWQLLGGMAAAIALAFSFFSWSERRAADRPVQESFAANADAVRLVTLADGSRVDLNAGARIDVTLTPRERRVVLRAGEAHFSVAKDAARPFVVVAGHLTLRAVGTAFNVRLDPAAVEVLVTEGRVAFGASVPFTATKSPAGDATAPLPAPPLSASPTPAPTTPLLAAGDRIVVKATADLAAELPRIENVNQADIARALAWQTTVLFFSETPLAEIVAQFNRRNPVQIVLADHELAARRLGGNIRVDAPETFVRVLETGGDIAADRSQPGRIVLRKTP